MYEASLALVPALINLCTHQRKLGTHVILSNVLGFGGLCVRALATKTRGVRPTLVLPCTGSVGAYAV